jgi:hypothetical protein
MLYKNSEEKVKETWIFSNLLKPYDSHHFGSKHPERFATITIICDDYKMNSARKNSIFAFNQEEFEKKFPNSTPKYILSNGKWWASKKMIKDALKKNDE